MNIDKNLERLLRRVEKPARYIGGEVNIVRKDPAAVKTRLAFAFPDTYEIGMSYMGLQILYNILNQNDAIACERVFAPATDMEDLMRSEGMPLFTLENFTPVSEMDLLGFTLQYEMAFTNVLNMLELGNIPVRASQRMEQDPDCRQWPVIIAGGPCAFNPEPLADFIDVFLIGDGEELLEEVCLEYAAVKEEFAKAGAGPDAAAPEGEHPGRKPAFLRRIAKMDGVYVPAFYKPEYNEDGTLRRMQVMDPAAPEKVRRAILPDIEKAAFPTKNLVPLIETVHDRSVVETFRGCTRGCRFCQAGMIYRPVRERKKETILNLAMEQLANTGHDELSLLSLSTSDYSRFEEMAVELMGLCRAQNVALSLPSLRLDSFSFKVLDEIQGYRKSGLTFAPEAGTQRLRDVINKNITEEDIYSATRQAIELGWEHIKLYFMIGLPTETYEDLDGIAEIARNIMDINFQVRGRKGGRFRVTVSVSNFVPKAHTPFQWEPQDTAQDFIDKHDYLSRKLRIKGVTFNYHESGTSSLEAVFARGDRRCGRVLEEARRLGCRFDAWSEHFDVQKWAQAFEACGVDPDFYTVRPRKVSEVLPWDHIDPAMLRSFLEEERERAIRETTTPDCREGCAGCGMNRVTECFCNV
ncbi:MAG: TIGR03960 family B12-binding radical SAM protein [Firmicutes bacterium]|nr:TIGR03960 family B12-binding radical SAM protein [Bacillota bacterium]